MIRPAPEPSLQVILKHAARPPCQTAPMDSQTSDRFVAVSPEILYFGTPVAVISTLNPDGTTNLAAMSSFWALGDRFMLGLTSYGQTGRNLARTSECVLNLPSPAEWEKVERLGHTTGRLALTDYHRDAGIVYAKDKFDASGFSPLASEIVTPLRAAECPVQIEARVLARSTPHGECRFLYFAVQRLRVHAARAILDNAGTRIDIDAWSPLFYVFRHYFGKGNRLAKSFRARY
jgi:flavin reductase (DIM6/NTAB) family NADH-FMN oxidoreductase RutF